VHRVSCLEGDHFPPCEFTEVGTELGGGVCHSSAKIGDPELAKLTADGDIVIVGRSVDSLDPSANIKLLGLVVEVYDGWVSHVIGSHDFGSLE